MRLINTSTILFEELDNPLALHRSHQYAIISHCWGEGEVSHKAFSEPRRCEKPGWKKIEHACRIARDRGLEWVWIDTCCINKESSAELTEAINSMFDWYRGSKECYVFLPDVVKDSHDETSFVKSRWFTRGWTLQELLAPWSVVFYDTSYTLIGTKTSLATRISEASGIESRFMDPWEDIHEASIAQRMSWAAHRSTTKPEDMAYALLGIFGINMTLLYGEGSRAFLRLQLKIIKKYDDDSIFAWPRLDGDDTLEDENCGMLASHPSAFRRCCSVFSTHAKSHLPYSFTSRGLQLHLPRRWLDDDSRYRPVSFQAAEVTVSLDCEQRGLGSSSRLAIVLRRSTRTGLWYRYGCEIRKPSGHFLSRLTGYCTVYVPQPELGQSLRPPIDVGRDNLSEVSALLVRFILRCTVVSCGLLACLYIKTSPELRARPLVHAAADLFSWSLWTMLWRLMESSTSFLVEMTLSAALICVAHKFSPG